MAAVLPMEARCALQVARTKGACRACVGVVEEGAAVCAALEERCAALKERYYEEHKRQRDIAESLARVRGQGRGLVRGEMGCYVR